MQVDDLKKVREFIPKYILTEVKVDVERKYIYIKFDWKGYGIIIDCVNGLHLSVFGNKGKLPDYNDLKIARYLFCPDNIYMAEIFPPKNEFINVHKYCRQLFQVNQNFNKSVI